MLSRRLCERNAQNPAKHVCGNKSTRSHGREKFGLRVSGFSTVKLHLVHGIFTKPKFQSRKTTVKSHASKFPSYTHVIVVFEFPFRDKSSRGIPDRFTDINHYNLNVESRIFSDRFLPIRLTSRRICIRATDAVCLSKNHLPVFPQTHQRSYLR